MTIRGRYSPVGVKVEKGTAQGQMLFWDDTLQKWVHTETGELFWDDVNKRLGIKNTTPTSTLDVSGTITATRGLFGGVTE